MRNASTKTLVLGTVGRLSKEKGHAYLIEAFSKLIKEYPHADLIIIGDGPLRDELERQCVSFGVKDMVEFTGYQDDVSSFYSSMDIFISPSLVEHFPIAILEAMNHGKAIAATDVGGTGHLIQDRDTGLLMKPASSDDIYRKLLTLVDDSALRLFLGDNARRFVRANYSLEKMVASYRKVYEEVIAA